MDFHHGEMKELKNCNIGFKLNIIIIKILEKLRSKDNFRPSNCERQTTLKISNNINI